MTRKVALYEIPEILEEAEILDSSILGGYKESLKPLNPRAQKLLDNSVLSTANLLAQVL